MAINVFLIVFLIQHFFREELKLCHQKIKSLTEQRNELDKEIEQHKKAERR